MQKTVEFLKARKAVLFGIADVFLVGLALAFAFFLRFEGELPAAYARWFFHYWSILAVLNLFFLWRGKLYAFTWSFVGLSELVKLVKAVTYANVVFGALVFLNWDTLVLFSGFPRSVLFATYFLSLAFTGVIRISKRFVEEVRRGRRNGGEPTLMVGAGHEGEQLVRNLTRDPFFKLVAIVDQDPAKHDTLLHNVPVVGNVEDIPSIVKEYGITQIVIALTPKEAEVTRRAVMRAREVNIHNIKIIPDAHELLTGNVKLTDIREVRIEDLLGRKPADIDTKTISAFIKGKTVFVTGAAGSIGSEIVRQCLAFEPKALLALDVNETGVFDLASELSLSFPGLKDRFVPIVGDVTNEEKMERLMKSYRPDVVFHAAAYKHVPLMEDFPEEAIRVNVRGTYITAHAARAAKAGTFVLISTDKAIRPVSVMGKTKHAAELVVRALGGGATKFVAVRFGNVIGSRGSVVPLFHEQIRRRAPVTITHPDMARYFMTIPEASLLVMEAGAVGKGGEVFMLDMGAPVKIVDLARAMIKLAGHEPDVDIPIVFTGTRPGEKIFEELWSDEEKKVGATQWDKIFITKNGGRGTLEGVKKKLTRLSDTLRTASSPEAFTKALDAFIARES